MIAELQILKTLHLSRDFCYSILVETIFPHYAAQVNDCLYSKEGQLLCEIIGVGFLGVQNQSVLPTNRHLLSIRCTNKEFVPLEGMRLYDHQPSDD